MIRPIKKWKMNKYLFSLIMIVFMAAFSYILLYPVMYMLSNAVRTSVDYIDPTVRWLPKSFTLQNFSDALKAINYKEALLNTVTLEMVSALLSVFFCAIYAYGLSRFNFRFKNILLVFLIITIMVPDVMILIPRVVNFGRLDFLGILGLFKKLTGIDIRPNIMDTPLTFYLPSVFGVGIKGGMFIFIYMQFFKGLPIELEEAASIDGAGPLETYLKIIIPSSKTVILTVLVFSLVWHWNDYFNAMMYTKTSQTLAVILKDIQQHIFLTFGEANGASALIFGVPPAACLLYLAPIVGIYMVLQKFFVESIDRVGIVG